jgi:hypothetical protein
MALRMRRRNKDTSAAQVPFRIAIARELKALVQGDRSAMWPCMEDEVVCGALLEMALVD